MHSKIPVPEKSVIPTTSRTEIDTTALSPSNPPPVITHSTKLQIHKWSQNTTLIIGDLMISGFNEKRLLKKYPIKFRYFPGASTDDMHHYLQPFITEMP